MLGIAVVAALPLAGLGIALALSRFPARWTRPGMDGAVRVALIAQAGCLAVSLFIIALVVAMLVEEFGPVASVVALPTLLHPALNVAGIVAWRTVAEALPLREDERSGTL